MRLLLFIVLFFVFMYPAAAGSLGETYCGPPQKLYGIVEGDSSVIVGPKVLIVRVEGIISSGTKQYVERAIAEAERKRAPLIIELNTPGGLLDPSLDIVIKISKSRVPIVGYVVDKWAESAGTLILVSTHIASMQPGTIIGSLQPVSYDPTSGRYVPINETKVLNPIIKALCEHGASKGRNSTALVRFVLFNDNYGASEALRYGVIDLVASSREELIGKLNGLVVQLYGGERVKLVLDGSYEIVEQSLSERVIWTLSDPLISGTLLSIGLLALVFSIASGNLPGIAIGVLLVILGLIGSGLNPNIASIALIAIGALLIFVELNTPGFGIIGGVGIVMIVLGVVLLPAVPGDGFTISREYINQLLLYIYAIGIFFGAATAFVSYKILKVRKMKPFIWRIEGSIGEALDDIGPGKPGFVIVEGEYWKAESDETIGKGEKVVVIGKSGSMLRVKKHK